MFGRGGGRSRGRGHERGRPKGGGNAQGVTMCNGVYITDFTRYYMV